MRKVKEVETEARQLSWRERGSVGQAEQWGERATRDLESGGFGYLGQDGEEEGMVREFGCERVAVVVAEGAGDGSMATEMIGSCEEYFGMILELRLEELKRDEHGERREREGGRKEDQRRRRT